MSSFAEFNNKFIGSIIKNNIKLTNTISQILNGFI